jgi:hypothetical protein
MGASQIFPERGLQSASRLTGTGGSGINSALLSQQRSPSEKSEMCPPRDWPHSRGLKLDSRASCSQRARSRSLRRFGT